MSHKTTVIEWIQNHTANGKTRSSITEDTDLLEESILDSLETMDLINFLEKRFEVSIEIDEMIPENFETPSAIAEMVQRAAA